MDLLVAWVLVPAALILVALGNGLLVRTLAGGRLGGVLLLPTGFAAIVVVAGLTTWTDATAELSVPACAALAAAGLAYAWPWRPRLDAWPAAGAAGAYAAYAAPVVLSGSATFGGYVKLDDTATFLAMTDQVLRHGRNLDVLAPSSYELVLRDVVEGGYPLGTFLPLGVAGELTHVDVAWIFQPYMALTAALLALAVYALVRPLVRRDWHAAAVALVAPQASLLYGYALWGGVKETVTAALVALVAAAAVPVYSRPARDRRALVPAAVAAGALVGVASFGAAVWLVPLLVPAVLARGLRPAVARGATLAGLIGLLSLPAIAAGVDFYRSVSHSDVLQSERELGNLVEPLGLERLAGVWPAGDFRFDAEAPALAWALVALAALAAAAAVVQLTRRREWPLPVYVAGSVVAALVFVAVGSPWVDAKAIAIATPAVLAGSLVGTLGLRGPRLRFAGGLAFAAIALGVLWSTGLGYRDAYLAPRAQLHELEGIGERYAGQGPALVVDYQIYGTRHFLRRLDPEAPGERRRRRVPLLDGRLVDRSEYVDVDQLQLGALDEYRLLVQRRSPYVSRPPSTYSLVERGRFYDVWERSGAPASVVEHLPLGTASSPVGPAACADVERLARAAGPAGRLVAARGAAPAVVDFSEAAVPAGWTVQPAFVTPGPSGSVEGTVTVPRRGTYSVWLGGSFLGAVEVEIDGSRAGGERHQLNWPGRGTPLDEVRLGPGPHRVRVSYERGAWQPGRGEAPLAFGPLALGPVDGDDGLVVVPAPRARELCGRSLDWIDAVRG